jgi:DNA-directed RNA polymerase sigma subunit (sigma70/sigma32)
VPGTENLVPTVNRLVRTSRRMLCELGREPNGEELARRLGMPVAQVRKLMAIAGLPIRFEGVVPTP